MNSAARKPEPPTLSESGRPNTRVLGLVYDLTVLAIAGSAMLFMFAGLDAGLCASAVLGVVASFALGYFSLRRNLTPLGPGVVRYGKLWVWMTVVAALSLITGKWQPIVFFALAGLAMTTLFALGGLLGSRAADGSQRLPPRADS
jgi:hypothetical protein